MHKNSHTISKSKPKIRIIHIFAPEIIKTDAANFRELVQRLTGKPTADDHHRNINCCTKTRILRKKEQRVLSSSNKKMEVSWRGEAVMGERIKGEEEIWRAANSGGGFLAGFAEFDGFLQELNQFPFLEGTTQMNDAYGGDQSQLA
ncbi:VQ motif-containing protein 25-like [Sesamum indicum]|uniref:VQ motif-containing protein 25-like n=1 Tax=Sesamum indicum TaxID=4182 RepID=A0A6I9SWU5_SESIN|nr:VQ motif-containing protein 25-like [Sesamum indicum]